MLVTPAPAAGHPLSALDGTRLDEPASEPRSPRSECRELMALRAQFLAPNLATFFANDPIELARASGCEVTDARGATYLDCINNVSHVGHCHPHVVSMVSEQLARLNTNSRYLNRQLTAYAERLTSLMPDPLRVLYMTCSGSEANETAWRIAQAWARERWAEEQAGHAKGSERGGRGIVEIHASSASEGPSIRASGVSEGPSIRASGVSEGPSIRASGVSDKPSSLVERMVSGVNGAYKEMGASRIEDADVSSLPLPPPPPISLPPLPPLHVAVLDHAYHGHTSFCADISPYKFNAPRAPGRPSFVHVLPLPDPLRGTACDGRLAAEAAVRAAEACGGRLAAFFAESIVSCGGQALLPQGYLAAAYEVFRAAGALCVADEVQCGFGRVGERWWAFELQNVVPDVVTLGKALANGFPAGAAVVSSAAARAFGSGTAEWFSTCGGSTAAVAAAQGVLDALLREDLPARAAAVGAWALEGLRDVQRRHPRVVGDVRGAGLMLGVELVAPGAAADARPLPNPALAQYVKNRARAQSRVLLSCEGPYANVIKIKPPLCFSRDQAAIMIAAVREALDSATDALLLKCARESEEHVRAVRLWRERE